MEITFSNKKLKKLANNQQECIKKFGKIRTTLLFKRLNDLLDAETLEDVRYLPGHYHDYQVIEKVSGLAI